MAQLNPTEVINEARIVLQWALCADLWSRTKAESILSGLCEGLPMRRSSKFTTLLIRPNHVIMYTETSFIASLSPGPRIAELPAVLTAAKEMSLRPLQATGNWVSCLP